tara:strand:+ start:137 stop:796 length:660 start_codon:yes stop_codon:yes gene_type:complete
MFQALGVHGPVLTPLAAMLVDIALVVAAFSFMVAAPRTNRMTVAALATLVVSVAAVRVLMQPLPNVQPVTVAALLVGAHLGVRRGASFAILVTLLSNLLISHGWWTLFQALGWASVAVVGARAGLIENGKLNLPRLCFFAAAAAPLFGFIATLSLIVPGLTAAQFLVLLSQGVPFDVVHALGNVAFALWVGPLLHAFLGGLASSETELLATGDLHGIDA